MKESKIGKIIGISIMLIGIGIIIAGIIMNAKGIENKKELGDCFDKYGNKIIGQQCEIEIVNIGNNLGLGVIFIMVGIWAIFWCSRITKDSNEEIKRWKKK